MIKHTLEINDRINNKKYLILRKWFSWLFCFVLCACASFNERWEIN